MNKADWKKLTKRELEDWEKDTTTNDSHFMWVGELPEIGEEVLVYTENSGYVVDKMLGIWGGLNFINNQIVKPFLPKWKAWILRSLWG